MCTLEKHKDIAQSFLTIAHFFLKVPWDASSHQRPFFTREHKLTCAIPETGANYFKTTVHIVDCSPHFFVSLRECFCLVDG